MKEVLTTGQVAKLCNVTIRTVIKWFEKGHLEGYKIPGSRDRRFPRDKVVRFMKEHGFPLGELEPAAGGRKRILLVDDEETVLTLLGDYLRELNLFDIEEARNGYDAGLKTQTFRPHLILLDYNLGDTTGADVARAIRQDPRLKDMKILVMSGVLGDAALRDILEQGVDDFLRKPFQPQQARDKIFHLLRVS